MDLPCIEFCLEPIDSLFIPPLCFESMDPWFMEPPCIELIAFIACGESGSVSPGTLEGLIATESPSTKRSRAMTRLVATPHGKSFSAAISAAMKAIQPMLMIPSANSAAISAQQQPTHQAPWRSPTLSAPTRPGRQCSIRKPKGLRQ